MDDDGGGRWGSYLKNLDSPFLSCTWRGDRAGLLGFVDDEKVGVLLKNLLLPFFPLLDLHRAGTPCEKWPRMLDEARRGAMTGQDGGKEGRAGRALRPRLMDIGVCFD